MQKRVARVQSGQSGISQTSRTHLEPVSRDDATIPNSNRNSAFSGSSGRMENTEAQCSSQESILSQAGCRLCILIICLVCCARAAPAVALGKQERPWDSNIAMKATIMRRATL